MDWALMQALPHLVMLPQATASLWRAVFTQRGFYMPPTLQSWKSRLDAELNAMPVSIFVDPPPADLLQLRQVYGFPELVIPMLPEEPELSQVLAASLTTPISGLPRQSQLAATISQALVGTHIVGLLVFDGLAYEDVLNWQYPPGWQVSCLPCIVDGMTLTSSAMPSIIGSPPLAHRLFQLGYKQHYGFAYWDRESNELTDTMFAQFSVNQLFKVSEFAQILERIAKTDFKLPTYLQIVRNGLDQFVHGYRERPNVRHFLGEMESALHRLLDVLAAPQKPVRLHITADHGILWHADQAVVSVGEHIQTPRYKAGAFSMPDVPAVTISEPTESYSAIVGPRHIFRARRTNEWGFHGGISGRESLVPFITLDYHP